MVEALVVGHICLDIIPELRGDVRLEPGRLVEAGPASMSTGGAVSNTGLALTKLGIRTKLIGKVGSGIFGRAIREILSSHQAGLGDSMVEGEGTSYTVVINVPGRDRTFLHFPGCNATFCSDDVPDEALASTRLMHLGYPPLLSRMYADDGAELEKLFRRAKSFGVVTSLDMSLPDAASPSGQVDWERVLARVLPFVDLFVPSIEEVVFMLDHSAYSGLDLGSLSRDAVEGYAQRMIDMGAKAALIKLGERGLYLRTSDLGEPSPNPLPDGSARTSDPREGAPDWNHRNLWTSAYDVDVVGTTGAGDSAVAGFLMGFLRGMSPDDALEAAVAVGACCCEGADAVSGVRTWPETEARMKAEWAKRI